MPNALAEHMRELSEAEQAKGRAPGLAAVRATLCRMAAHQFDDDISEQLSDPLSRIDDFDHLAEIEELIFACKTGEELLSRANGAKAKPPRNGRRTKRAPKA